MMDHRGRADRARERLASLEMDALLITDLTNVRYLTGFSGSNGQVLLTSDETIFMSDGRYAARAAALVQAAEISIYPSRLTEVLAPRTTDLNIRRLGFEAGSTTVAERDDLAGKLPGVELAPTSSVIEDLRRVKDKDEIAALRRAIAVADEAFVWLLDRLGPGSTEREVALDLEIHMRSTGADEISFDPIVGSGPLSAHIHHTPSDRAFEKGDLVLVDFGARVDGYCSDMTRTVVLGPATDEQAGVYGLVLAAHEAGIAALRAGVGGAEADAAARDLIEDAGRGADFGHGLGHGVGLDIHEGPRLHRISEDTLRAGDVVTIEPGVYTDGWGGIRIEDCVLVSKDSAEVLGSAPKRELIQL